MTGERSQDEPFGAEAAHEGVKRRFENVKNSYDQILNRLWAGNSAGTLAAIGALGSEKVADKKLLLVALILFLVGVAALGVGSGFLLIAESRSLRNWQKVNSILDLQSDEIRSPSEEAGGRVKNLTSLCAAVTLVLGTICGLILAFKGFW